MSKAQTKATVITKTIKTIEINSQLKRSSTKIGAFKVVVGCLKRPLYASRKEKTTKTNL